jgi:hypothetical protein
VVMAGCGGFRFEEWKIRRNIEPGTLMWFR